MDQPAFGGGTTNGDPLFTQQHSPVYYVPPLRIVAPPGVAPFLPNAFDPLNTLRTELFRQSGDYVNSAEGQTGQYPPSHYDHQQRQSEPEPTKSATSPAPGKPATFDRNSRSTVRHGSSINGEHKRDSEVSRSPSLTNPQEASVDGSPPKKKSRESKPKKPTPPRRGLLSSEAAAAAACNGLDPHRAVINTLRLYDALRRTLLQDEESKDKDTSKSSRPDLNAGSVINQKGLAVNRNSKIIGPVPGIDVGDPFYFRMELCCVGMHGPIQGGIEYLTMKESEYNTPVAISIISSGGYDAKDDGEELIYTGQGGKSTLDSKPNEDQKLERGNLAMEGSMQHQVPVRVTRGVKDNASPSGKTYTYDGLYKVEKSWSEKGKSGFEEFKFKLRRLPGQPELGSAILKLSNSLKYKPAEREGLRVTDIANGKEGMPVCVVNTVDDANSPPAFEYSTSVYYPHGAAYDQFGNTHGCECTGACTASEACSCFVANGGAFAYLNGGILVKERNLIYECGSNCNCSFSCRNRLTQRALKYRLEVFKTEDKGWGLRSWETISAGSFICEYTGRLIQNLQPSHSRDYIIDTSRLPKNNPAWGDVSSLLDKPSSKLPDSASRPTVIIDSSQIGNASRFINHSCSPNILVQCVMRDHQDTKRPHLMLFAMDNIPPFRELTMDYGTQVQESESQAVPKHCLCKSQDCKGTFYQ